ncbi:hypothetical protein [Streptomyces sp. 6N106]|uniref:hypothetical protein n=1 Tax=Streptomyces sp. 6N106 TaxID=3457418 RepID=UPI003FD6AFCC
MLDRTRVPIGGGVRFTASIRNVGAEAARPAIDYVVHHRRANGSQSARTFKLTTRTLGPDETIEVSRDHSIRLLTTLGYHPGPHALALQINGVLSDRVEFEP